jgi:Domain of unknown function (DUF4276)
MREMHPVEVLVEELSAERALTILLPRIIPDVPFRIRGFQGKDDLLKKLPQRLRGYAAWPGADASRIVVLVDQENDDCAMLRRKLDTIAADAGFRSSGTGRNVLNRLAIEELEAWFIGDMTALNGAYPRVPASSGAKKAFRNPDSVRGTWEALERLLKSHGYHKGGLPKTIAASTIANHMNVEKNESRSFQMFRDGLRRFVETEVI